MKKTKIISFVLVIILTSHCLSNIVFAKFYTDTISHWAKNYIDTMTDLGIMESTSESYFYPSQNFTRKEAAKSACMLFIEKNLQSSPLVFNDVSSSNSYSKYIKWMYDNGVMSGTTNNTFSPDNNITRQDMCVVLYNLYFERIGVPHYTYYSKVTFSDDSNISAYAKTAVYGLQKIGVVARGESFRPKDSITRAEVATLLYELWDYAMVLSTPQQQQIYTNWCWAASAKVLAEYRYTGSRTQTQIADYINSRYINEPNYNSNSPRSYTEIAEAATWGTYNNINHSYGDVLSSETIVQEVSLYKPLVLTHGYYEKDSNGQYILDTDGNMIWVGHAMVCIGYVRDINNENNHHLFIYDVGDNSYFWATYNEYKNGLNKPKVLNKQYVHTVYSI